MTLDDTMLQDVLRQLHNCVDDRRADAHDVAGGLESLVASANAAQARVLSQAGAMIHAYAEQDIELGPATDGVWRMLQTISVGRLTLPGAPPPQTPPMPQRDEDPTERMELPRHAAEATAAKVAVPEMPKFVIVREEADLIVECAEECIENVGAAENAILELETDPDSDELVNTVFRAFHTIKGIAGFLDLGPVSHLSHSAESLLSKVRSKELTLNQGHSTALLQSVDCLGKMLADLQRGEGPDGGIRIDVPENWSLVYESLSTATEPSASSVSLAPAALSGDTNAQPFAPTPDESPEVVAAVAAPDPALGGEDKESEETDESAQVSKPKVESKNTKSSADAFVRVRTDRLDQLLDAVGELVIAQTMVSDRSALIEAENTEFAETISQTGKIVRELQDLAMSLRMVPMASTFQRMSRVARDVATKCQRQVRMETVGEDTEIDRNLVSLLSEPLIHMIRNAVDHGIESGEARIAAGKDPVGTVTLSATAEAGRIAVRIRDDGGGLNAEKLIEKARKNGILGPNEKISDADAFRLIFHAGFSTAEKVTATSGRGVGMDVVRRNVELLGGRIQVDSVLGEGTTFSIYVPLTLAITDGMIVGVAEERYILPTLNIVMSFQPSADILACVPGCGEVVLVRGRPIPIVRMHDIFDIDGACTSPTRALLVLMADGERRFALLVDEVVGQHQVVTKALDVGAQSIPGLGGAAILGDGRVGLIVDPGGMAQRVHRRLTPDTEQVSSLH
ncbi:MAG: chemotaxis protein CheA [Polyangiales bacterium]